MPRVLAISLKVYKLEKQRLPAVKERVGTTKNNISTEEMELKMSGFHSFPP